MPLVNTRWAYNLATRTIGFTNNPAGEATCSTRASVAFPLSNLIQRDRYLVTDFGPNNGVYEIITVNLGAFPDNTATMVGLLNFSRTYDIDQLPDSVEVFAGQTTAAANLVAGINTNTVLESPFNKRKNSRDMFANIAPRSSQYWTFKIGPNYNGFTLGGLLVGQANDLGIAFSPGSSYTQQAQVFRTDSLSGQQRITKYGPTKVSSSYVFENIPQSVMTSLQGMYNASPVALYAPDGDCYQMDMTASPLVVSHVWGNPPVYSTTVAMEALV